MRPAKQRENFWNFSKTKPNVIQKFKGAAFNKNFDFLQIKPHFLGSEIPDVHIPKDVWKGASNAGENQARGQPAKNDSIFISIWYVRSSSI